MRDITELKDLDGKHVLVRIDTDVDIVHDEVVDDYRLKAALPTIRHLAKEGATITLIGHMGRPDGKVDAALRLKPVARRLAHLLVPGSHLHTLEHKHESPVLATHYQLAKNVILLENLRFDPGEEANEPEFVALLTAGQDYFVNESFATVHREAASTVGVAKKLPSYAGLRLIDELAHLNLITHSPGRPFTLIVGGAKMEEKLGLLAGLLSKVDHVLVGGVVANTFADAEGIDIKKSLVDSKFLGQASELLDDRDIKKIQLPLDYSWDHDQIVDIGSQTISEYTKILKESKTIFWAGSLGKAEDERFAIGTKKIAQVLAEHEGLTIVGGGDTTAALQQFHLLNKVSFASTGGGAALEYVAGKTLPGLAVLR